MTTITMRISPEVTEGLDRLQEAAASALRYALSYSAKRDLRAGEVVATVDIEADPFDQVVYMKSRQLGLTAYRDYQQHILDQVASSLGISYEEMSRDYDLAQRSSITAEGLDGGPEQRHHRRLNYLEDPTMTELPWTTWNGDDAGPDLDDTANVFIRFRNGAEYGPVEKGSMDWAHAGVPRDIVAYREDIV